MATQSKLISDKAVLDRFSFALLATGAKPISNDRWYFGDGGGSNACAQKVPRAFSVLNDSAQVTVKLEETHDVYDFYSRAILLGGHASWRESRSSQQQRLGSRIKSLKM
jgi:hypothetical protein